MEQSGRLPASRTRALASPIRTRKTTLVIRSPLFLAAAFLLAAAGVSAAARTPLVAARTGSPVKVDGRLDDAAWKAARPYALELSASLAEEGWTVEDPGTVRLLHNEETLWLSVEFQDCDVVSNAKADDEEIYTLGDVAEVFLRPTQQTWYWELHAAPNGLRSTYWWPGRGRLNLRGEDPHVRPPFWTVAAAVEGTLNDWRDKDRRWTAEIAIPIAKLLRESDVSPLKGGWSLLVSRYNYTRWRRQAAGPELTSAPRLPKPNYHLLEDYAPLKLAP